MFIHYFVPIDPGPFGEVERALLEVLGGLPGEADVAYRKGEELRGRLRLDGAPVAKAVRLEVGEPHGDADVITVPLTWEATGTPGLFPHMEADLVVTALGEGITHLALQGTYRPPLGRVGAVLDRALFHRVAELSVRDFVDRLAASVVERMALRREKG